jgi:hypothetical protein
LLLNVGNVTWTNMPAAATEFLGVVHRRARVLLADTDRIRLVARVSTLGSANAVLRAEYSLDESAWSTLTPDLAIGGGSAGTRTSSWGDVPAEAKNQDVVVRLMGESGNGTADPVLGNIALEYR